MIPISRLRPVNVTVLCVFPLAPVSSISTYSPGFNTLFPFSSVLAIAPKGDLERSNMARTRLDSFDFGIRYQFLVGCRRGSSSSSREEKGDVVGRHHTRICYSDIEGIQNAGIDMRHATTRRPVLYIVRVTTGTRFPEVKTGIMQTEPKLEGRGARVPFVCSSGIRRAGT